MNEQTEETKPNDVDLIAQILKDSRSHILERVKEDLKKQVIQSLTYSAQNKISAVASEFIEKEMAEDLKAIVIELRQSLLDEIRSSMPKIAASFGEMLLKQATKNFQVDSYKTRDIIKNIFE